MVEGNLDINYWNLVVRANPEYPMSDDRMLEGTLPEIKARLFPSGGYNLQTLASLPVVMTREFDDGDLGAEALIGYMDYPSLDPKVSTPVMRIASQELLNRGFLGKWGNHRTRWTVLQGNPFRLLADCASAPFEGGPRHKVRENQVAVMMPFDKGGPKEDPVYRAIRDGAEKAGFNCCRVDELRSPTVITDDLHKIILESGVVIVDLTGMNPNVMYELGYALGCGKSVYILSSDDLAGLPFDIRQRRVISYSRKDYGLSDLSREIAECLGDGIA